MSDPEPGGVAVRGTFVIDDELPKAIELGKGAFHDPALSHRHEAPLSGWRTAGYVMLPT